MDDQSIAERRANTLMEQFWAWRLETCPEFATFSGFHDHGDKLQNFTLEAIHDCFVQCKMFLEEAMEICDLVLEKDIQENLEFLVSDLNTFVSGHTAGGYFFTFNFLEGPQKEFERLIDTMPHACMEDYHKIFARYKAFPVQISQIINLMREGIKQKMTFHEVSVKSIPDQLDQLQDQLNILKKDPKNCVFYKPFTVLPDDIPDDKKEVLLVEAIESISHNIFPAFKSLKEFILNEYLPNTRKDIASSSLPNGDDFYQMCLDFHLGYHMTPDEIHDIGLREVKRITSEMEKVIASLELDLSVKEFSNKLRADKSFYFNDADELLSAYQGLVENQIYPLMPKVVSEVPKGKLKIEPEYSGPAAFYLAGTLDGRRPGIFYINVGDVKSSPKYDMITLALHEAIPGHHLQMTQLMENNQLADFRKYMEDRKYSFAPSRFPCHTAYAEGWGLYSEYLGYELQLYEDPYFHYGHLSYEMLRAVRLVVDTGMHAFGWSYDKALQYMLDHTATSIGNAEGEIKRYITWPGQACAYKIGELKIKSLREMAEQRLGSKFHVQEFHHQVLLNYGPLKVLEQKVNEYVLKRCLED